MPTGKRLANCQRNHAECRQRKEEFKMLRKHKRKRLGSLLWLVNSCQHRQYIHRALLNLTRGDNSTKILQFRGPFADGQGRHKPPRTLQILLSSASTSVLTRKNHHPFSVWVRKTGSGQESGAMPAQSLQSKCRRTRLALPSSGTVSRYLVSAGL